MSEVKKKLKVPVLPYVFLTNFKWLELGAKNQGGQISRDTVPSLFTSILLKGQCHKKSVQTETVGV